MADDISKHDLFVFAVILIIALISGCAGREQVILVQSSVTDITRNENVAEVTATPRYSKMVSQIKSVALKAPTSCADESAAKATGKAEGRGDIVKTLCGVEMAEIERALVRQGFIVYSWNLVNNTIGKHNKEATAIEAAKWLGAQVLFQVNSLERVTLNPGRDTRLERSFFKSNSYGDALSPLELDENQIKKIKALIGEDEIKQLAYTKKLGAMLDISAVDSETGQTIWFYRWTNQKDTSKHIFAKSLVHCNLRGCHNADIEYKDEDNQDKSKKRNEEIEDLSISARPASEQDAIYFNLLKDVTIDFVKHFSSGR